MDLLNDIGTPKVNIFSKLEMLLERVEHGIAMQVWHGVVFLFSIQHTFPWRMKMLLTDSDSLSSSLPVSSLLIFLPDDLIGAS